MNFTRPELVELMIAYGVTAGAMLVALWLRKAERRAYIRWPVFSVMAMVIAVVTWNLLREHALPPMWSLTHAGAMYAGALAMYGLFGTGMGVLVSRLTRSDGTMPWEDPDGGAGSGNRDNSASPD
jgi:hypothetical protein